MEDNGYKNCWNYFYSALTLFTWIVSDDLKSAIDIHKACIIPAVFLKT